jgi:hypothetical protein
VTPAPTATSPTSPPPVGITVGLGPVQQSLLFLLLVALLRRLGILPPPDDDSQDVRYLLSSGTTEAALTQLRAQIASTRPWCLPQFDRLVQQLQSTGCTVIV